MNEIYYLLEFHKKCCSIIDYGDNIINKYCSFVNFILDKNFTLQEQIQLKLNNFNYELLYKFAYSNVDDITFNNIDKIKLAELFDKICYIDIDDLK